MKVTLKNFRCYENQTFDFGVGGLALLSGASGKGKSSIFLGIYFALFGIGTKLTMYGKTSCLVILEFDGMVITRTKKPNRVIVKDGGGTYEDDVAQSVINIKFGETFETTGYISQNAKNSFILMSPIEKLGFLEKFAFQDTDLLQIKIRCKNVINERYEKLLKTTSQLEMVSAMVKELKEPEYMEFPMGNRLKKIKPGLREKEIKNTTIKYKNSNTLISKCAKKIKLVQKELHSLELFESKIQSKEETIDSINKKLKILFRELDIDLEKSGGDSTTIELISLQTRYEEDIIRLNIIKEQEVSNTLDKIKILENDLWLEYTEEESRAIISDYKVIIRDIEKIKELQTDLSRFVIDQGQLSIDREELEKLKEEGVKKKSLQDKLEMQKGIFECPSCNKNLKFISSGKLELSPNKIELILEGVDTRGLDEEILKLKKKMVSLGDLIINKQNKLDRYREIEKNISEITLQYEADELTNLTGIKKDLEYVKKYIAGQQIVTLELNTLKIKQGYSNSTKSFENSIETQKKKIDFLVKKIDTGTGTESMGRDNVLLNNLGEEYIRTRIITEKQKKTRVDNGRVNIKELEKDRDMAEKQITGFRVDYLKEYPSGLKISELNLELSTAIEENKNLEKMKQELFIYIQNIEKYQEYEKAIETYKTWTQKVNILGEEEIENRKQYGAATMLKEKILEAESISMLNVISCINTHSQVYLDSFFTDHPISVKLVPFKETKKGKNLSKKPQINLQIEYKGMEADLTSLSGGETTRVILAFTLALGEMFNTPIMLLDECTASLDQELTSEVMEGIRENFNGKLVLIIAHQVTKGSYDKVIEL